MGADALPRLVFRDVAHELFYVFKGDFFEEPEDDAFLSVLVREIVHNAARKVGVLTDKSVHVAVGPFEEITRKIEKIHDDIGYLLSVKSFLKGFRSHSMAVSCRYVDYVNGAHEGSLPLFRGYAEKKPERMIFLPVQQFDLIVPY